MTIEVKLIAKWRLKSNHNYVWTNTKMFVNIKTGKILKKTTNGNGTQLGYFIDRKFVKINSLNIELIPNLKLPF